jgi:hypothetical protein
LGSEPGASVFEMEKLVLLFGYLSSLLRIWKAHTAMADVEKV